MPTPFGALPHAPRVWQGRAMVTPVSRSSRAGGFPIAAGVMLGCMLGFVAGQPTVGFFVGLGIGSVIAVALWLRR